MSNRNYMAGRFVAQEAAKVAKPAELVIHDPVVEAVPHKHPPPPVIRVQMGNYDTEVYVQLGDEGRRFALPQSLCRSGVGLPAVANVIQMIDKALAEMNKP